VTTIAQMAREVHELSKVKGWWAGKLDPNDRSFVPEKLMLIVSEASEALESYRNGEPLSHGTCKGCLADYQGTDRCINCNALLKPEGISSELADIVIRVGDLAERLGIDLERAVREKHSYNATRAHRHGGKVC
jgi:NTP pyrophosphatase (non-canonical NTP hydrolase)